MEWTVYILRCSDDSLYTGITTDVKRRVQEHNGEGSKPGARYTHYRRPVTLEYKEQFNSRSLATKREIEIKKLRRNQKIELIKHLK